MNYFQVILSALFSLSMIVSGILLVLSYPVSILFFLTFCWLYIISCLRVPVAVDAIKQIRYTREGKAEHRRHHEN